VAVIDSGVDGGHPDLAGRIAAAQAFGIGSPTTDTQGHGTHTAGLACGQADNAYGIASMGFHCSLFIAKIGSTCFDVSSALTAAANRNSDVINMSIGGCDASIIPALDYAQSRGSVLVVAADNTAAGDGSYPEEWAQPLGSGPDSGFDRGVVVTSVGYDGARSSFAELTTRVSVAAYGSATNAIGGQQGILSTWPANSVSFDSVYGSRTAVNGDSRFAYLVGTSMATPQVAGVAALMRSVKPDLPNTQIVHLIKATATHCGAYGDGIGWGVIRADEAVAAALNRDLDPPTSQVVKAKRIRRTRRGPVFKLRLRSAETSVPRCAALPVSGVKQVIIFAKGKGRTYHRIGKTSKPSLIFHGKRHRRYRFYSVAVDNQGNREAPPALPDIRSG
jgi:subtilisin family serine protease